jgi:hypothetical protein
MWLLTIAVCSWLTRECLPLGEEPMQFWTRAECTSALGTIRRYAPLAELGRYAAGLCEREGM